MASLDFARDLCEALEKQGFSYVLVALSPKAKAGEYDNHNFINLISSEPETMIAALKDAIKEVEAMSKPSKKKKK